MRLFLLVLLSLQIIYSDAFLVSKTSLNSSIKNKKRILNIKEIHMISSIPTIPLTLPFTLGLNVPTLFTSIALPSSLGFWKREYGVSYGYGGSLLGFSYWTYLKSKEINNKIGMIHSALHMIYGARLIIFLLYREIFIPKFRELTRKIEDASPPSRIQRAPFIIQCGLLYFFMSCPLLFTTSLPSSTFTNTAITTTILKTLLGISSFGLFCEIIGDTHKSISKAINGQSHLVTNGLFSIFRHPNYTGELILWSSSTLTGILSFFLLNHFTTTTYFLAISSLFGLLGISFVLAQAAGGLERRQQHVYGNTDKYKQWIKKSWEGVVLKKESSEAKSNSYNSEI